MKLKVLGTKSPYAPGTHNCPGFLITEGKYKVMLDSGSGTHSLLNIPSDLMNLYVFDTHLHEDHYCDTGIIQYAAFSNHNLKRIENPVHIYLPSTPVHEYNQVVNRKESFAVYDTIQEDKQIKIGNLSIDFCRTDHPIETYAIKVSDGKSTIVYTSDTSFSAKDKLVDFAKDANLLICESSLLEEHGFPEINSHLTAKQAGIIAKEANVRGLILTHFWPDEPVEKYVNEAKTVFENVVAAMEGFIIDFSFRPKKIIERDME